MTMSISITNSQDNDEIPALMAAAKNVFFHFCFLELRHHRNGSLYLYERSAHYRI